MSKFKVGDSVLCITPTGYLVLGQEYTVKSVDKDINGDYGIMLNECGCKTSNVGYNENRFVPAVIRCTISVTDLALIIGGSIEFFELVGDDNNLKKCKNLRDSADLYLYNY